MIDMLRRAPWWLWALAAVAVLVVLRGLAGGRQTVASRHLTRNLQRTMVRARTTGEQTTQALKGLADRHRAEDMEIDRAEAAARARIATERQQRLGRGPGPRRLPVWLLALGCCTPSYTPAQVLPTIDYKTVAVAEVPPAESQHDELDEEVGPCAPDSGRWVIDGRSSCWPCPPFKIYIEGAGEIPEGCPAPAPGVWVELERFNTHELDTAGLKARVRTTEQVLNSTRARETRCLEQLEQTATEAADALEPCVELAEQSRGHGLGTVAGVGIVGAAVGLLVGALAL